MNRFTTSDGHSLAYYVDDFTDPWRKAPTLLLLHAAMGSARRYYAWDEAAKNDPAYIGKFVLLMASYDWSGEVERIGCPTMVVIPGAETVGTVANYDPFRKLRDVEFHTYEGLPHNICDAVPERCAADVLEFLQRRFGAGSQSRA